MQFKMETYNVITATIKLNETATCIALPPALLCRKIDELRCFNGTASTSVRLREATFAYFAETRSADLNGFIFRT